MSEVVEPSAEPLGPLSQMMVDNADTIDAAIEQYGPSAVSEFFINVGTSMAALYQVTDMPQGAIPVISEEGMR